ncbi:alcohol dehydrogenase GroES domain protein [Collybia nuda]|uniref:Alcohol dehydrogenase GroES domain protein n=1 Tax=Collybia nuda TaxID=64659 RepID=A0A9P5Y0H1_9AGAR|nr:alcohol dehydrogenase GroES domain protein [Collybia nuda]
MKAARYYGPGDVRVEQIPEPEPKRGQVKIKIAWNGICGTDLHAYLAPFIKFPTNTVPNEITGETLPVTLGHEFSGIIVGLGEGVDSEKHSIGQAVCVEPIFSCMKINTCAACRAGTRNLCNDVNVIGIGGFGGGLAEYIAVDENFVHTLPDNVSLEVGACIEPLAVAWYAVKRSSFKSGDKVLICGAGPIGIFLLKVLRSLDPTAVIVTCEPTVLRRSVSLEHGATIAVDPASTDVVSAVHAVTEGQGVDIAFDAAGVQESMNACLHSVKARGLIVNVASWEQIPKVDTNLMLLREITITASNTYTGIHPELLQAVGSGKLSGIESLVTSKVSLEDVVDKGIKSLLTEKDKNVKILIHP